MENLSTDSSNFVSLTTRAKEKRYSVKGYPLLVFKATVASGELVSITL